MNAAVVAGQNVFLGSGEKNAMLCEFFALSIRRFINGESVISGRATV